jgi:hypothetical protein
MGKLNRRENAAPARKIIHRNPSREEFKRALLQRKAESRDRTDEIDQNSSQAFIKRVQKDSDPFAVQTEILQYFIKQAENKITEDEDLDHIHDENLTQEVLFIARAQAVKDMLNASNRLRAFILDNYKDEIEYSKVDVFPRGWMRKDKRIKETLDRYGLLKPLLNHIFNLTRYVRGGELKKMKALNDAVIGAKYSEKNYDYSSFVTDKSFYDTLEKKFGRKPITMKKYMRALSDAEIIKKVGIANVTATIKAGKIVIEKRRGGATLYTDGFYAPSRNNTLRKHSFLKNTKEFKESLRSFRVF